MTVGINQTNIRLISAKDVAVVTDIIRNAFKDVANRFDLTKQNCPKHPSNCKEEWIQDAMNKGVYFYILEKEGAMRGCVALEKASPEVCYLERLAILPADRRCGYGGELVEYALNQAKTLGVQKVDIGIIAAQTELKVWYQKFGFKVTRKAAFDHLPFEVLFMSKGI